MRDASPLPVTVLPLTAFTGFALRDPEARRQNLWREGKRRNHQAGGPKKLEHAPLDTDSWILRAARLRVRPPRSPQVSRRQREKRSTSNKIRVQRLINNITQNPHHPLPQRLVLLTSGLSHPTPAFPSCPPLLSIVPPISSRAGSLSTRRPIPPFFFHKKKWLCRRLKPGTCTALAAS